MRQNECGLEHFVNAQPNSERDPVIPPCLCLKFRDRKRQLIDGQSRNYCSPDVALGTSRHEPEDFFSTNRLLPYLRCERRMPPLNHADVTGPAAAGIIDEFRSYLFED